MKLANKINLLSKALGFLFEACPGCSGKGLNTEDSLCLHCDGYGEILLDKDGFKV